MSAIKLDGLTLASTANSAITIDNVTLGGDVAMASSGLTVRNITQVAKITNTNVSNDSTLTPFFTPTYTPLFAGSKVLGILTLMGFAYNSGYDESRKRLFITLSGSGITTIRINNDEEANIGINDYGNSGAFLAFHQSITLPLVTASTTDVITATCALQNLSAATTIQWAVNGNNTLEETFMTWMEFK